MRRAIFFDRDNTLLRNDGYLGDPEGAVLVPGAPEAVARARRLGFAVVVVSNQSGVARGLFGEEDVRRVNRRLDELLKAGLPEALVERHEFCPFHPEALVERYRQDSFLRKPRPGMLLRAAREMDLDLGRSWMIGDAARDIEAAAAAGCRAIWFVDPNLPASPAAERPPAVPPHAIVASLEQALDAIEEALAADH